MVMAGGLANATILNSKHDLSSGSATPGASNNVDGTCVFCHTPHQPNTETQDPLWNHDLPASSVFSIYHSATIDGYTLGEAGAMDLAGSISLLCMGCHDGVVGLGALINDPNAAPPSNLLDTIGTGGTGTDLTNDHPVGIVYADSVTGGDVELVAEGTVNTAGMLFGGKVECASCHDPHNTTNVPFLVKSNLDSAICTTCHSK